MTTPRAAVLDAYVEQLWDRDGSDLLLTANAAPLLRVDGHLQPLDGHAPLDAAVIDAILDKLLTDELKERFRNAKSVDFSFNWRDKARLRANAFRQRATNALAVRMIPHKIPTFEELRLADVVEDFVKLSQGFVLVTGPTGSGKSTTLASVLDRINEERRLHILTIEDPIEYVHVHKQSAVNQREVGDDADTFASALRAALREDPDVILVGEMRDLETIQIALTLAETGHLVFATLHTNDTAQSLDRIIDVFPAERQAQIRVQLANSLSAIVHQRLLPRIDGGRVAAFEVLKATPPVRNLIREGKTNQIRNVILNSQKDGMQTLEASLSELVREGLVDYEEAVGRSLFPKEVKQRPEPLTEAASA